MAELREDLSRCRDYRVAIKNRLCELRPLRPGLTLRKVAAKIPIQYTYLSKALNDEKTHLNEDDLFQLCQVLEFYPQEIDVLLLLRARQTAALPARRAFVERKLERARKGLVVRAQVRGRSEEAGTVSEISRDLSYLTDPFMVLVHVALNLPAIRQDPRKLVSLLGISQGRLREILKHLALLELIEMGVGPFNVTSVKASRNHYSREHPLMRTHQQLFRTAIQDQLLRVGEEDKECFQVTFTSDRATFEKVREELRELLKRVQKMVPPSKNEHLLQLNFDCFVWA